MGHYIPERSTQRYVLLPVSFSDLYDRSIVGWEVYEEESAELASDLIKRITLKQGRLTTEPLVLHSDNGSPMKGATMLSTLYQLGITPSNSRPRVSNDNPYAESLFKILKYRPNYQPQGFATLEEARNWVDQFVNWYNDAHHHSGLNFLTPSQRRSGESEKSSRNAMLYMRQRRLLIRNVGTGVTHAIGLCRIRCISILKESFQKQSQQKA